MLDQPAVVGSGRAPSLVGRDSEIAIVDALLADSKSGSHALLVLGDAGIGKSALLANAVDRAEAIGFRVVSATGVQAEIELPFAALHQLLRPLLGAVERLPPRQRDAIRLAFGQGESATPDRFLIGLATLGLLSESAEDHPLLLAVDDPGWFDRASLEALAFAVRRLDAEPIALVIASRDEESVAAFDIEPHRLLLRPLDGEAAMALLDRYGGAMEAGARARILEESAGNPLAIIELGARPASRRARGDGGGQAALRPTARLRRAFAHQLGDMPAGARLFLTIASAAESEDPRPVLQAARAMGLEDGDVSVAEELGLLDIGEDQIRFRHPLARSVVYRTASVADRRAAHQALAAALAEDPDRRAWHLAALRTQPDESAAAALEATADRARLRAGYAAAARALERAAELSPDRPERARRLALAVAMAFAAGRPAQVEELTIRVFKSTDDAQLRAQSIAWLGYVQSLGASRARLDALSPEVLRDMMAVAPMHAVGLAMAAAGHAGLTGDRVLGATVEQLVRTVPGPGDEPWRLYVLATANPEQNGVEIAARMRNVTANPPDDYQMLKVAGLIAWQTGDVRYVDLTVRAVEAMRTQGDFGGLAAYLAPLGIINMWRGRIADGEALAEESIQMGRDLAQPGTVSLGHAARALAAALRGESDVCAAHARLAMNAWPARQPGDIARWALGLDALGKRRFDEAIEHLSPVYSPEGFGPHMEVAQWVAADFVEAALATRHQDATLRVVAGLDEHAERSRSPHTTLLSRRVHALLADGEHAEEWYQRSLATDGAEDWQFEHARTRLAYGNWLRRRRRIVEARSVLTDAFAAFSSTGAVPWAERAQAELRASGVQVTLRAAVPAEILSPQQLQIARLAASGLTNREIAERLFLSPRTVGAHLYKVFPKLRIANREQLARAMKDYN